MFYCITNYCCICFLSVNKIIKDIFILSGYGYWVRITECDEVPVVLLLCRLVAQVNNKTDTDTHKKLINGQVKNILYIIHIN